jgi:histidine triad (HIT) family protein
MSKDCIFCKIVKGELPCQKVWEDEKHLAFLSIDSVCDGHTIIIPKEHFENIFDISEESIAGLNVACKTVSLILKNKLGLDGVNILNNSGISAGQEVMHIHFHVFPRFIGDENKLWFKHKGSNLEDLGKLAKKIQN